MKMTTEEAFVKVLQMHGIDIHLVLSDLPLCQSLTISPKAESPSGIVHRM
ncbi:MAG: hypothetical protein CM1200mP28_01400 [Deltaproteobacteria bacterium]|nr:MAG: hypothetical protein CM1200mP28_01400 [Deltaproteobacteria bacterium]